MPIHIRPSADPLSEQSLGSGVDASVITIQSEAGRVLLQELERYCRQQIQGRSFLIAGHRGAGKTTTVQDVLLRVIKESERPGQVLLRPLPVLLHGPNLFMALAGDSRSAVSGVGTSAPPPQRTSTPSAPPADLPADDKSPVGATPAPSVDPEVPTLEGQAEVALKQVVLGLHRATAREFTRAYRQHVLGSVDGPGVAVALTPSKRRRLAERAELAAQFEIELLEDPPASRLREFWEHGEAMDDGVLRTSIDVRDRGARELVALNGICNAHQRVSGELAGKHKTVDGSTHDENAGRGFDLKMADALKPLATLLAGAAVASGTAAATQSMTKAAMAGVGVALLSSVFVRRSESTMRKRERTVDTTFIPDLRLRTLDRILPTLLERLREAGLAPVFVIDELDKINCLPERIVAIVHYLKKLFAETVFTCFLTDRGYLEHLRVEGQRSAYSLTYSYFSHPLVVAYEPADLHLYLGELLVVSSAPSDASPDTAAQLDLEVLKWVLRHRSQMHALELMRLLGAWRDASGRIDIAEGLVRTSSLYKIDATFQVAIEYQLAQSGTAAWRVQRPGLRQALLDALYFLSRAWLRGDEDVDLSDSGRVMFESSLRERMNLRDMATLPARGDERDPALTAAADRPVFGDDDLDDLIAQAIAVARLLCDTTDGATLDAAWPRIPAPGAGGLTSPKPSQTVLEAILLGENSVLYREPGDPELRFRFRYRPSGDRRLQTTDRIPRSPQGMSKLARTLTEPLRELEASLWKVLRRPADPEQPDGAAFRLLADESRVLPTTPAWSQVRRAGYNLDQARHGLGNLSELTSDFIAVRQFHAMLTTHWAQLEPVLQLAGLLGGVHGETAVASAVRYGLALMSSALGFATMGTEAVVSRANESRSALLTRSGIALPAPTLPGAAAAPRSQQFDADAVARIETAVAAGREFAGQADWMALASGAWGDLERRLGMPPTEVPAAPDAAALLCAARGEGPAAVLPASQRPETLVDCTRIVSTGMRVSKPEAGLPRVPVGVIGECLRRLGAGALDGAAMSRLVVAAVAARDGGDDERARLRELLPVTVSHDASTAPALVAVAVGRSPGSAARRWTLAPARGLVFVVEHERIDDLASLLRVLDGLAPTVPLVWEPPADAASPLPTLDSVTKGMPSNVRAVRLESVGSPDMKAMAFSPSPDGADALLAALAVAAVRLLA